MSLLKPMRICSSQEMRELDLISEKEYLIDASILMENAGKSSAQLILEKFPNAGKNTEILIFAGKGNNAGDAFVVARQLICLDRKVRVFHLNPGTKQSGATQKNFEILKKMKARLTTVETISDLESFFKSSLGPYTIVDGILGTGLKGELDGIYYDVVEMINGLKSNEVISLDIPTGVNGDTGMIHGTSILANLTLSLGFPKLGHFLPPGAGRRGELINLDISLPPRFRKEGDKFLLTKAPMSALIKERDRYGHKNSFGHTLLIGGSPGRLGAIAMAARACHKMGTGLVTTATWEECFDSLFTKLPNETMSLPLKLSGPEYEIYKQNLDHYTSIVIGPGLGVSERGRNLIKELLSLYHGPIVIDADALNLIAEYHLHDLLINRANAPTVLTPHPGEMARFLKLSKESIKENPIQSVREAVQKTHAIVVLKGAATLIGSPEDHLYLNHYPNDGMATAGSGDVLSGMIGGLLGQKMDAFQATLLGVFVHSLAGEFAAKSFGHRSMTAPDIIDNISHAFKELKATSDSHLSVEARTKLY